MSRGLMLMLSAGCVLLVLVPGCRKKPKPGTGRPGGPTPIATTTPTPSVPPEPVVLPGRDSFDSTAPQVQGKFPKTGQAGQWVKVTEVKFYEADQVEQIVGPGSYFGPYGVDWAAEAQYRLGRDPNQLLVVQLFHCRDSADGFGLMSVASDQPAEATIGQESRGGDGTKLHIWTGSFYLYLWSEQPQDVAFVAAMRQLARDMAAKLGGGGSKPAMVRLMPTRDLVANQVYYFRGASALASRGLTTLVHDQALAAVLALETDDELAVLAYTVAGCRTPCFIFVARYGRPEKASAAHARLTQLRDDGATVLGQSILVGPLTGSYVFGTLTGEEYGLLEKTATAENEAELPVFTTIGKALSGGR